VRWSLQKWINKLLKEAISYAGSIAAAIQSSLYGAYTAGAFSGLQAFGATAVIASPAVLAVGGTILVVGAGVIIYGLYQKRQRRLAAEGSDKRAGDDDDDDNVNDELTENHSLIKKVRSFPEYLYDHPS